jgi:hypothetical protein
MRRALLVVALALLAVACADDPPSATVVADDSDATDDAETTAGEPASVFIPVGAPIPSAPQEPGAADDPRVRALCAAADDVVALADSFDHPWTVDEARQLNVGIGDVQRRLEVLLDELGEGYLTALYDCLNRVQAIDD